MILQFRIRCNNYCMSTTCTRGRLFFSLDISSTSNLKQFIASHLGSAKYMSLTIQADTDVLLCCVSPSYITFDFIGVAEKNKIALICFDAGLACRTPPGRLKVVPTGYKCSSSGWLSSWVMLFANTLPNDLSRLVQYRLDFMLSHTCKHYHCWGFLTKYCLIEQLHSVILGLLLFQHQYKVE